jgi:hypothetical protein
MSNEADYIIKHGENEWETCIQGKCNNPNCPFPTKFWWNKFVYNKKTNRLMPLLEEWYVTDNNKHHYASSIPLKRHMCLKTHSAGRYINKYEDSNADMGVFFNTYVIQESDSAEVKGKKMALQDKIRGRSVEYS